jgi:hypothetical protein
MDWIQALTIIGSFAGLVLYLDKNHREDMKAHKEDMRSHKEDLAKMDDKIDKIDAKWEKLFNLFVELKLKQDK